MIQTIDPNKKSICFSRTSAYGDIILTSCFLENVKLKYPHLEILFHTDPYMIPLFLCCKTFKTTPEKQDCMIVLNNIFEVMEDKEIAETERLSKNRIERMCTYFDIPMIIKKPQYYITEDENETAFSKLASMFPMPHIGIAPSSKKIEKTLGLPKWKTVIEMLLRKTEGTIFIFDSLGNEEGLGIRHDRVKYLGNMAWRGKMLYCLMVDVMVTHDSLWSHLAGATGTPQVLLTSCTDGKLMTKDYTSAFVVEPIEKCYPCFYRIEQKTKGCARNHPAKCFDDLNIEHFIDYVISIAKGDYSAWQNKTSKD
jgi:ADP-heptose:LPS heptosyltransferase